MGVARGSGERWIGPRWVGREVDGTSMDHLFVMMWVVMLRCAPVDVWIPI